MIWAALALGVQTPYLRIDDNLEEPENAGFCIDLRGWNPVGFENAQAHSCKPSGGRAGGGTDEEFEPRGGAIVGRAAAAGHCLQAKSATAGSGVDVPLCDASEPLQRFPWSATTGTLRLEASTLCLGVGADLRAANTFWARDLILAECGTTDAKYITWRVEGGATPLSALDTSQKAPPSPPLPPPASAATSSARAASWALGLAAGTATLLSLVH